MPTSTLPRLALGHVDGFFCSIPCGTCENAMLKRSRQHAAAAMAENFGPRGSRAWREAYNSLMCQS